jgi:hypothetical protein
MCPVQTVTYVSGRSAVFMRRFTLSPFYQIFSKSEFAKNLPKARAGGRTARLLSSTALSSIHTRLILRACDPNPRVLRETSREI